MSAIFNKLFSIHKDEIKSSYFTVEGVPPNFTIPLSQIRVVIFREGSSLIYDSRKGLPAIPSTSTTTGSSSSSSGRVTDQMLSEMMFGSIPLSLQGVSTKVHYLQSMGHLVISKIFCINQKRNLTNQQEEDEEDSSPSVANNLRRIRSESTSKFLQQSHQLGRAGIGSYIIENYTPGVSSLGPPNSRPSSISIENGDHKQKRDSVSTGRPIRTTFAVAIVFNLTDTIGYDHAVKFLTRHFLLIDLRMRRLLRTFRNSLTNRTTRGFQDDPILSLAVDTLRFHVHSFFHASRLPNPAWLCISLSHPSPPCSIPSTTDNTRNQFAIDLLDSMKKLKAHFESGKSAKHFLSTFITSILSNHTSWSKSLLRNNGDTDQASGYADPLLAQMEEAFGFDEDSHRKMTKVVIVASPGPASSSSQDDLVCRLLFVASYFLRYSPVVQSSSDFAVKSLWPDQSKVTVDSNVSNFLSSVNDDREWTNSTAQSAPSSTKQIEAPPPKRNAFREQIGQNGSFFGNITSNYIADLALHAPRTTVASVLPLVSEDLKVYMDHAPFYTPLEAVCAVIADPVRQTCEMMTCDRSSYQSMGFGNSARTYCQGLMASMPALYRNSIGSAGSGESTGSISSPSPSSDVLPMERIDHSPHVASTLDSAMQLYEMGVPVESVLLFIEDRLHLLLTGARALSDYIVSHHTHSFLSFGYVARVLSFDEADMNILAALAMSIFQPLPPVRISLSFSRGVWAFQLVDE